MMFLTLVAVFCGVQLTAAATNYTANICYLAVAGTAVPTQHPSSDCSTFLQTTVEPVPVTPTASITDTSTQTITYETSTVIFNTTTAIYSTITTTLGLSTTVINSASTYIAGTTTVTYTTSTDIYNTITTTTSSVTEPSYTYTISGSYPKTRSCDAACIPAYASPCSGVIQYSSACSALGVTATTLTIPAVTVGITISPTVTVTTSILTTPPVVTTSTIPTSTGTPCANALPTFSMAAYTPEYAPVSPYVVVIPLLTMSYATIEGLSPSTASIFSLNAAGNLLSGQQVAAAIPSLAPLGYSQLWFVSPEMLNVGGILVAVCQISANNVLSCSAGGAFTALIGCGTSLTGLDLGSIPPENCFYEYPVVFPVCVPLVPATSSILANSSVPTTSSVLATSTVLVNSSVLTTSSVQATSSVLSTSTVLVNSSVLTTSSVQATSSAQVTSSIQTTSSVLANSSVLVNSSVLTASVTSTAPASTLTSCANALSTFAFQAYSAVSPQTDLLFANAYFINSTTAVAILSSPTLSQATNFSLNAAGNLLTVPLDSAGTPLEGQLVAVADPGAPGFSGIYFVSPDSVSRNGNLLLVCQISASNVLSCSAGGPDTAFVGCDSRITILYIGNSTYGGCLFETPQVVYLCTP